MTEATDIHALAGAYALDAIDDVERAAFERHLLECITCALEVAELKETAGRLADPLAEQPPPWMRDSVLAAITRTPQERRSRAVATRRPNADRWRRWAATAAAASILATGSGVAAWNVAAQGGRDAQTENARIEDLLTAPDVRLVSNDMAGGKVRVLVSPSRNAAVAVLSGLRSPGGERVYQLWMVDSANQATSVGLLAAGRGSGRQYIPDLHGGAAFAVSNEPAGGSRQPSLPVVGAVTLS